MTPLQSRIPACAVCVPTPRCLSSGADGSQGIYVRALGSAGQVSNVRDAGHRHFISLLVGKYVPALKAVSGFLANSSLALTSQLWHAGVISDSQRSRRVVYLTSRNSTDCTLGQQQRAAFRFGCAASKDRTVFKPHSPPPQGGQLAASHSAVPSAPARGALLSFEVTT